MLVPKDLHRLISSGESEKVEFKQSFNDEVIETIDQLKTDSYQSQKRNKLIAIAFFLTMDIEKYGSGYIRIRKEIQDYPTMTFDYKEVGNGFLVEIKYVTRKFTTITRDPVPENVPEKRLLLLQS